MNALVEMPALKSMSLIIIAVLISTVSINTAYAQITTASDEYPSPLQQQREGISIDDIKCNAPRELYLRDSQTPVCIFPETYNILIGERYKLGLVLHESYTSFIYAITDAGESEIKRVVEETINRYNLDKEDTFDSINKIATNPVSHYPFVLDPETKKILAHGADQDRIGIPSLILGDYADIPYYKIITKLQNNEDVWVDYVFIDPSTSNDELKRSWLVLHDGYIFGSGFYYSIEEKMSNIIDNAIELYKEEGTFDSINAMYADITSHYPFVIDPDDNITVAHGAFPDIVGTVTFANQDVPYSEFAKSLEEGTESISQYAVFQNPSADELTLKHNIFKLYDGYLFGAGYYYSGDEKVKNIVKNTIEAYKADKERVFVDINSQSDAGLTPHYRFVIDPDTKAIIANGGFPTIVGNVSLFFSDHANKSAEEIISELSDGDGIWVEYTYNVPGTDFEEKKRSYLELHDGYIFGSGYYFSTFTVIP